MVGPYKFRVQPKRARKRLCSVSRNLLAAHRVALCSVLLIFGIITSSRAALQFDVFLGYDGVVPEAAWFPVICEIKNDGPSFNGVVELSGAGLVQGQSHRVAGELPPGTPKPPAIPGFSTPRGFHTGRDVRVLDERRT